MPEPTVCVYAIFKDEAEHVERWAASTVDADHRLVLDTGSTDATPELLRGYGVEVRHAVFDPFRFDDARNAALALCPTTLDLCLRLDADETLADGWRAHLDGAYGAHFDRYRYPVINYGQGWERIMRDDCHRRHGLRWKYPTHEVLVGPGVTANVPGMWVEHHPPVERRFHHNTNLMVLGAAVVEYPGDARMAFYYARELWYTGFYTDCRERMMRFLDLPTGWGPERCEAWRILAAIDDYPERWLWKAVGEAPERREPWCDLARLYLIQERDDEARAMVLFALVRDDPTIYTTQADCWGDDFARLREAVGL
jgi:glycosyltransferase involved in cell wall biosynthesis